jgi:hypothetical protein
LTRGNEENFKFQTPSTKEASRTKLQTAGDRLKFGIFEFLGGLKFGF